MPTGAFVSVNRIDEPEATPEATGLPSRSKSTVKPFVTFVILNTGDTALVRLSVSLGPVSLALVKSGASGAAGVEVSIVTARAEDGALVAAPPTVCRAV